MKLGKSMANMNRPVRYKAFHFDKWARIAPDQQETRDCGCPWTGGVLRDVVEVVLPGSCMADTSGVVSVAGGGGDGDGELGAMMRLVGLESPDESFLTNEQCVMYLVP